MDPKDRQACFEMLAMALHLCETYDVRDSRTLDCIVRGIFLMSNNDHSVWFHFLNPFGNVHSVVTTDSLYPFEPAWKSYQQLREKTWITHRHLKALTYYLNAANKYLFLVSRLLSVHLQKIGKLQGPLRSSLDPLVALTLT